VCSAPDKAVGGHELVHKALLTPPRARLAALRLLLYQGLHLSGSIHRHIPSVKYDIAALTQGTAHHHLQLGQATWPLFAAAEAACMGKRA
jgi:hypothetical protein